jgi:transposase
MAAQDARLPRLRACVVIAVRLGALGLRRYAEGMPKRRPYPSDLSDARWELVKPVLAAWRFERRGRALDFGRPPEHDLRDIMDVILYVDRTGAQWRYLPHDFPHWNTVYGYFARWQQEGVFAQLNGLLRQLLRQKEGRETEPSACVIDAPSVKTSTSVLATSQGIDAGKKIVGRKRSIVTDTIGLVLAVLVTAASVQDSIAGTQLLDQVTAEHPSIRKAWVDGGYRQHLVEHAASPGTGDSPPSRNAGRSSGPTAGSCSTAGWPATTKPIRTDPKP